MTYGLFALRFAAGTAVGYVVCRAPFAERPAATCGPAMRNLAERRYAQLARR